jgi:hypothetical protein
MDTTWSALVIDDDPGVRQSISVARLASPMSTEASERLKKTRSSSVELRHGDRRFSR